MYLSTNFIIKTKKKTFFSQWIECYELMNEWMNEWMDEFIIYAILAIFDINNFYN